MRVDAEQRSGFDPLARPWARPLAVAAIYCLAYVMLEWATAIHEWSTLKFTLWSPAPALALALLALFGVTYTPILFAAALLAGYTLGQPETMLLAIFAAAVIAIGYGWVGIGLRWFLRVDLWDAELKDLVAVLVVSALGAMFVAVALVGLHYSPQQLTLQGFLWRASEFWISDATGILALLPVLLLVGTDPHRWLRELRAARFDIVIFLAGLTAAGIVVFFLEVADEFRFFYLLFIPVIWLAVRRHIFGGTLAVLMTQIAVVASVLIRGYPIWTFFAIQMLMLVVGVTGLLMGAAVSAWHRANERIRWQQAEMDRAARIAAVGTMGSAIAHEISQPLASISTYARACQLLLKGDQPDGVRLSGTLQKIVGETERAGEVLRNMRDSIAAEKDGGECLDLGPLLSKVIGLMQRDSDASRVQVALQLGRLRPVVGNRLHLEQVLLNIVRNAVEATANYRGSGTVAIVAGQRENQAEISISDQGPGVDEEIAATLFEPFVSTKPQGLGLGLAISRHLIRLGGGEIRFRNPPGGGARFTITIPSAADAA